MKNRHQQ
jgi:hypothetical protein